MFKITQSPRNIVLYFLVSGLIFASLSLLIDYAIDHSINLWKFLFNMILFGGLMTLTMIIAKPFEKNKNKETQA